RGQVGRNQWISKLKCIGSHKASRLWEMKEVLVEKRPRVEISIEPNTPAAARQDRMSHNSKLVEYLIKQPRHTFLGSHLASNNGRNIGERFVAALCIDLNCLFDPCLYVADAILGLRRRFIAKGSYKLVQRLFVILIPCCKHSVKRLGSLLPGEQPRV